MITVTVVTDETSVHKYSALTVLLSMNHTSTVCDHVVLAGRLSHKHSHVEVEVSSLFNTNTPVSLCDRLRKHSTPSTRSLSTIIWMTWMRIHSSMYSPGQNLPPTQLRKWAGYRFATRGTGLSFQPSLRYDTIWWYLFVTQTDKCKIQRNRKKKTKMHINPLKGRGVKWLYFAIQV